MGETIIQADVTIEGDLLAKGGTISINGHVSGDIEARAVQILAPGTVEGSINAEDVAISGQLQGSVKCDVLSLSEESIVSADVAAGTMTMKSGADLTGRVSVRGQ
ncbi:polymer-forming cytoskeletal protein [Roseovarius sp.]|uniref:bactofilin family protein n=1 Tax=Roseovarius sp. TaxID=1486281 RepID=UPI0035647259